MFFKFGKAALYERLLQEKDRQIDILAEQIDYLRLQLTVTGKAASAKPLEMTMSPVPVDVSTYVSDEELDAEAMLAAGEIAKDQLPEVLESLGLSADIRLDLD